MSSKSLFGSFKYCLKSLLILGLFPWKFDGDKQTLRALDLKIHMTIVFANYVIWSLPYDIHYFPFVVKEFSGNMPNSEILLFLFIIRRVNSFVFYVTLPIAHHITCMSLRQKFCHFYETNQKRLNLYNITWTINKLRFWIVVCILLVSFLVLLYCDANSSLAIVLNETEVVAFPIVFSVIKEIQCLLIMAIIVGIILEISSALFSFIWFKFNFYHSFVGWAPDFLWHFSLTNNLIKWIGKIHFFKLEVNFYSWKTALNKENQKCINIYTMGAEYLDI